MPDDANDPRRFGHSRDRRSDCAQVVVALVVTPEGLPLAYEMLPGRSTALHASCLPIRPKMDLLYRAFLVPPTSRTRNTPQLARQKPHNPKTERSRDLASWLQFDSNPVEVGTIPRGGGVCMHV
jgi:hypothetical protein